MRKVREPSCKVDRKDANAVSPRVALLVRRLDAGGIERQVLTLAQGLEARGWHVVVLAFYGGGAFEKLAVSLGVTHFSLGKRGRWDVISFGLRLVRAVRREQPDVLYTWLPVPSVIGALLRFWLRRTKLVWAIPYSDLGPWQTTFLERIIFVLQRILSRVPSLIIPNSYSGATALKAKGFPNDSIRVIQNGIDTDYFTFCSTGRSKVRREWGVMPNEVAVGIVARVDPVKNHLTFLSAAALLAPRGAGWRFICVGSGPADYCADLISRTRAMGLSRRVVWAGCRDDMPAVYSSLDVVVSSSLSEGLPNVIVEAMACGRPCVVTDVGDSAMVVGELGEVVRPGDPAALARAIERSARTARPAARPQRGELRNRVKECFSSERLAVETDAILRSVLD